MKEVAPDPAAGPSKATLKRLRHARAYLELGMLDDADAEISAIDPSECETASTLAAKAWLAELRGDHALASWLGGELANRVPQYEPGWIHWARALRLSGAPAEAATVLHHAQHVLEEPSSALFGELSDCYRQQGFEHLADVFLFHALAVSRERIS